MPEIKAPSVEQDKKIKLSNTVILFIILVVMFALFSYIGRPFFLSTLNLVPMLNNLSYIGIVAAVLTMVMVTGEIDFSIGGNIGLTAVLIAFLLGKGMPDGLCL